MLAHISSTLTALTGLAWPYWNGQLGKIGIGIVIGRIGFEHGVLSISSIGNSNINSKLWSNWKCQLLHWQYIGIVGVGKIALETLARLALEALARLAWY